MAYLNLKKRYPFTCPACGNEQEAAPSLFMQTFQANVGGGSCLECSTRLYLSIDEKNEGMVAEHVTNPDRYKELFRSLPDSCFCTKDKLPVHT